MTFHKNNLENTACPVCKCEEYKKAYDFAPFAVVRCNACRIFYLNPRPAERAALKLYKNGNYYKGQESGYSNYFLQESALRATFRKLLQNLKKRNIYGGSLLEVGCGYGYLLEEANGFFEYRAGTDFSEDAVLHSGKKVDLVVKGGVEALPPGRKFDCIISMHVIEHVYNPKEFLEHLLNCLNTGGHLVIGTPDMGSFWRFIMGRRWSSFKIPEHVLFFDKNSLSGLMHNIGLQNINILPYPHAFPVSLVAEKFGISFSSFLDRFYIWIPATTIAVYGTFLSGGNNA